MENYSNRNHCTDLGIYNQTVDEQFSPYIRPQENGTKGSALQLSMQASPIWALSINTFVRSAFSTSSECPCCYILSNILP